jgi:hypothetical protein
MINAKRRRMNPVEYIDLIFIFSTSNICVRFFFHLLEDVFLILEKAYLDAQ